MKLNEILGGIVALLLAYFLANLLTTGFASLGVFPYGISAWWLVPSSDFYRLGRVIGTIIWNLRSVDIIAQVIVLFSAAIGALALLRREDER